MSLLRRERNRVAAPTFAVAVDAIESVEPIAQDTLFSLDESRLGGHRDCVRASARRAPDGAPVLAIDSTPLLTAAAP